MPFCTRCGNSVETGEQFCPSCGASLERDGDTVREQAPAPFGSPHLGHTGTRFVEEEIMPPRPRRTFSLPAGKIAIVVLVLLVIGAGAYVLVSNSLPLAGKNATAGTPAPTGTLPPAVTCPEGQTPCQGTCADLKTDGNNCGRCGFAVPYGMVCRDGQFASLSATPTTPPQQSPATAPTTAPPSGPCPSGQNLCSGKCTDLRADNGNCGRCGWDCPKGQICQSGQCLPPELTPVSTAASGVTVTPAASCSQHEIACGGSCVDVFTDKKNCGVCGRACGSQEKCLNGRCGPACSKSTETLCGDTCFDLRTDPDNCGACGTVCPSSPPNSKGTLCAQGKCYLAGCSANFGDCNNNIADGCETDLRFADSNCGTCGNACPSGLKCSLSQCT